MPKKIKIRYKRKTTPQTLEVLTPNDLKRMSIYDSEGFIRLMEDPKTKLFIVFHGGFNQSCFTSSYQQAEHIFKKWVRLSHIKTTNAKK